MSFQQFADQWIEKSVDNSLYRGMKDYVREFVALMGRQRHSGASASLFISYIFQLMNDYHSQGK